MKFVLQSWQLFVVILASWINRQQQEIIEYLRTENAVLKEKLGRKRILLSDDQRRRLAVKGEAPGPRQLELFGTVFTPDTILRWNRQLVAKKWDYSNRREKTTGRPRIRQIIVDLTLQFARENPTWGYDRIQGAEAQRRPWVAFSACRVAKSANETVSPQALVSRSGQLPGSVSQ